MSFVLPSAAGAAGNQTSIISLKVSDGVQHLKCPAALWSSSHGAAVSSSDSKVATATLTTGRVTTGRVTTPEVDITPVAKGSCTITVQRSSTSTSDNYKWTIAVTVEADEPPPAIDYDYKGNTITASGAAQIADASGRDDLILKFTQSGSMTIPTDLLANVLVVGGGGSGEAGRNSSSSDYQGNGGGGAKAVYKEDESLLAADYEIVIGAGGARAVAYTNYNDGDYKSGMKGGKSSLSGGDLAYEADGGAAGTGHSEGQKNSSSPGTGGSELSCMITGTDVLYGRNGSAGSAVSKQTRGGDGAANTGAGGGGGRGNDSGAGGSGVVIVRFTGVVKQRTPVAKPVVAQGLVYGYTNQVGVAAGENYALSGVTVTNAVGTYEVTATLLDDDHCWDDQTTKPLKLTWSIACRAATVTVIDTNKVTGAKEPVFRTRNENFIADDPQKLVWTSFRTNTSEAAGMYDVIVRGAVRQGGYEITYVPGKLRIDEKPRIPIARPVAGTGFVYGYTNQSVVAAGEGYTLGGDLSASAVGKYETTVTLEDGYSWDDGTIEPLTFSWSIGYRKATVTVINTNKVTGAEEPFFRTRNENFLADDPTELEWIAWRTNTSEAVGTYDIVVDGEVHQGGYEITYVGGTLTITEAPPPGPTIVPVTEIPEVIRDVEPDDIRIVSQSGDDITAAFTLTGSAAEGVTVTLNPKGAVTIGEGAAAETITVVPQLTEGGDTAVEPFEVAGDEVDVGVKTIPGLKYTLRRSETVITVSQGATVDAKRAETTRTKLRDPFEGGRPAKAFYRVEVGK